MVRFVGAALLTAALFLRYPCFALAEAELPVPGAGVVSVASPEARVTAASLQALLDKDDYLEFAHRLPNATGLRPEQEQYFKGTLAYREGRFGDVVNPLIAAVETRKSVLTASQIESAFEILGQASAKTFLYSSSAKMYDDIDKLYGSRMGAGAEGIREKRHIGALLEHVPAQTVEVAGDFSLQRTGIEYPVSIGGRNFSAQLDTGASISLLSESTAKDWGVTLLDGTATLPGYGGGSFSARPGLIPVLQIGKAELRNVVVFVTADQNLYISEIKRQTHALLGYPVASALGRLTFSRDGSLTVTTHPNASEQKSGAPMWVGDGSLLVALGTVPVIKEDKLTGGTAARLFELDTGSGSTYLTDHYLAENRTRFSGEPTSLARLAGAGGVHEIPAYEAHRLPLFFGNTPVLCTGQHVLTQPQGGEAENYFGVVGQDVLQLFSSYTVDFQNMRFRVVP
jgi:Aspartyl protease